MHNNLCTAKCVPQRPTPSGTVASPQRWRDQASVRRVTPEQATIAVVVPNLRQLEIGGRHSYRQGVGGAGRRCGTASGIPARGNLQPGRDRPYASPFYTEWQREGLPRLDELE